MTRNIGGNLDMAALGALLGDRPDRARDHARPHDLALADAADHARRSLNALRAVAAEAVPGDTFSTIGRCGAALADVVADLDRIRRAP